MAMTLAERIEEEKIKKSAPYSQSVKAICKMRIRFDLAIQRNLRWDLQQKTGLIDSILRGFPIPAVYALRSEDKDVWLLDGKQRLSTLISFRNDEWELGELVVYGEDITGLKYSELPEEFRDEIDSQQVTFYQFDSLTTDQRDELFKKLNSGTPLQSVELVRSILGTDNLEFINKLAESTFIKKAQLSDKQIDKFVDQELVLQTIAIITGKTMDLSGKNMKQFAIDLRIKGLTDDEKHMIETVYDFLSEAFAEIDNKDAKKVLKKTDIIGIVGAAWDCEDKPEVFANLLVPFIKTQSSGSLYGGTKSNKSASKEQIEKRIQILQGVLGVHKMEQQESERQSA